jgi:hypothetical protein
MNCTVCGRNLQEDSRYCDFCGTQVPEEIKSEPEVKTLDTKLLFKWIFISIFITVAITLIANGVGIPILFGGLFLPFFFKRKKKY